MVASLKILDRIVKIITPFNRLVTKHVDLSSKNDFNGDVLLQQFDGLGKAAGALFSNIEKVGNAYQAMLTRAQLSGLAIFYRDSLALLQAGSESRLKASQHAAKDEQLMDSLINKPSDEDQIKSRDMIAMSQNEELTDLLAAKIRSEMRKNPQILSKLLASSIVNNTARLQEDAKVVSLLKDLVLGDLISPKNVNKMTNTTLNGNSVASSQMADNVIEINFQRKSATLKVNQASI